MAARILFALMTIVASVATAISHVVNDSVNPGQQEWVEKQGHSGRSEPLTDTFTSPTSAIRVTDIHAPQKRDAKDCISVYLCTEENWTGDCYWACFRKGVETHLESDWAPKIKSARPAEGAKCKFFFGPECRTRHKSQDMVYPGGNFNAKEMSKLSVGCFYCMK